MVISDVSQVLDFYPRPPRGGRLGFHVTDRDVWEFLSTPSARRATEFLEELRKAKEISIHALREEGDQRCRRFGVA